MFVIKLSVIFVASFAERYFQCQVPGCGSAIVRPWNHISQGQLHSALTKDDKRMYIELTKAVGEIFEEEVAKKRKQEDDKQQVQDRMQQDQDHDEHQETETETSQSPCRVVSSGRQRFGETKTMPMFSLDTPILTEFMK